MSIIKEVLQNLDNPEYLEIILDGCRTLEERSDVIDHNRQDLVEFKTRGLNRRRFVSVPVNPDLTTGTASPGP